MEIMPSLETFQQLAHEFLPGNKVQVRLGLLAILLGRHVLIEDVPGMGKTTLVKFFAEATGLDFRRIQFTSDLLPSDILGASIFQKEKEIFLFRPGPIFGELILADELNRGTPKTQSALLEAMEERSVTVEGVKHPLPEIFSLFATQNPRGQYGTNPLPESQLDRFFFKFSMGHLTQEEEIELLQKGNRHERFQSVNVLLSREEIFEHRKRIQTVTASKELLTYLTEILEASRKHEGFWGLSTRAGLDLLEAARGLAYLDNRTFVAPDDVQEIFPFVAGHRMFSALNLTATQENLRARDFVQSVPYVKGK
jgi:MoxR-like ATPase